MGGRRTTKEDLAQLEALTKEGCTAREIAQKISRSPASIRNLRYKKHLVKKTEDQTKTLFQQKNTLSVTVACIENRKTELQQEINNLVKEKEKLLKDWLTKDDLKNIEYICQVYGDTTQIQAIQRALRDAQWKALLDSLKPKENYFEKATFGINAPVAKDETKTSATPWSVLK